MSINTIHLIEFSLTPIKRFLFTFYIKVETDYKIKSQRLQFRSLT